jgi:hypothetical protein
VSRNQLHPPAPRPCDSCPYRKDVPSGIWHESQYEKLPLYDAETPWQPPQTFQCHLTERDGTLRRICAGWAGCHDTGDLLALRLAVFRGAITPKTYRATVEYRSPVPLFASGAEAATHGIRDIKDPSAEATRAARKIMRLRKDIVLPQTTTEHEQKESRSEP